MSETNTSRSKREKIIKNAKTAGDIIMYIGSAAMTIPTIQKAKENQNSIMGSCAVGAGAMLSIGIGKIASNIFNKVVDKAVDFWDDMKTQKSETKEEDVEEAE